MAEPRRAAYPSPPIATVEDPLPGLRGQPVPLDLPRVPGGPWRNILVRTPNWVGDAVMAFPALKALRTGFPDGRITLLTKPHLQAVFRGEPYFDDWIRYEARGLRGMWRLGRALSERRFDLALVFPHSISAALVASFARIPTRVGYTERWVEPPGLLTHPLRAPKVAGLRQVPMVDYYLHLAYAVGCPPSSRRIGFQVQERLEEEADRLFRGWGVEAGERVIGVSPGASFGSSKLWSPESFAWVTDRFCKEYGARALILCGPREEEVADRLVGAMEMPAINTSREVVPLDLLKAVASRLMLLLCTDSGARHFAVGTGTPAVVVMGPTYHVYTETEYERYQIVHHRLDCWPCHKQTCPLGHHRCMEDLPPERVLEACRRILARFPPG